MRIFCSLGDPTHGKDGLSPLEWWLRDQWNVNFLYGQTAERRGMGTFIGSDDLAH